MYSATLLLISMLDGVVVKATPRPLYPREKDHVSIAQEAEWKPGSV